MENKHTGLAIDTDEPITEPRTLAREEAVEYREETETHETEKHWDRTSVGVAGQAVVGVRNEAGETLVLIHEQKGVALLPYGQVEPGSDWNSTGQQLTEAKTGIEIETEAVLGVTAVDHVVADDPALHETTTRVIFRARPVGGEIQPCKQTPENGSDDWRADWVAQIPESVSPPSGGPEHDFELVMD